MAQPAEPKVVTLTDPLAIRALAHPARMTVIDTLYSRRTAMTSTQLAELVDLSPSAMSYHLRSLEKYGIVKRAPSDNDAREQPWIRAAATLAVNPGTKKSTALQSAAAVLISSAMEKDRDAILQVIRRRANEDMSVPLDPITNYVRHNLLLTLAEAKTLSTQLNAMLKPFLEESRKKIPKNAARVMMTTLLVPN